MGDLPELVELSVESRRDKAAVRQHNGRIVGYCAVDEIDRLRLGDHRRRRLPVQTREDLRDRPERRGERLKVARVRAQGIDLLHQPLKVAYAGKETAERGKRAAVFDERLDAVEACVHVCGAGERTAYPVA